MGRHEFIFTTWTAALLALFGCSVESYTASVPILRQNSSSPLSVTPDSRWTEAVTKHILADEKLAFFNSESQRWVLNQRGFAAGVSINSVILQSADRKLRPKGGKRWHLTMDEIKLVGTESETKLKGDAIKAEENRISIQYGDTMKQVFSNDEQYIEQQFEILTNIGDEFELHIKTSTNLDWQVDENGMSATMDGKMLLHASAPKAFDGLGQEIPAKFIRRAQSLIIQVTGAKSYPVLIDPAWEVAGEASQASWFGWSVAAAGDINNDGFDDVVVTAPFFNAGNQSAGKIYLYYGDPQGLSATPAWSSSGDNSNRALFGWSVASGDFNGDGYSDLAVGAPSRADTGDTVGKAFVFLGSFNGPLPAVWTSSGDGQQGAFFGTSIASAGDTNGDGFDDLLVGAPAASMTGGASSLAGKAFLFVGSSSGPSSSAAWTSEGDAQPGAGFGWSVASAGDVNADGFDDMAVGAHLYDMTATDTGRVYLYLGAQSFPAASAAWAESGDVQEGAQFGWSISAGAIDADGYSDLVVGAPGYDAPAASAGRTYAYRGGDGGTGLSSSYWWVSSADGHTGSQFGWSVAVAGDVNDDGYGEVLVGAPGDSSTGSGAGKIWIFNGSAAGPLEPASFASSGGEQAGAGFGGSVAGAGDVNKDGAADFLVGAYLMDSGGSNNGAAYLYLGTPGGGPGVCEPEGASCDDHDDCTSADKCDENSQCHGTPFSCDDGNPCTDDVCRPDGTCSFLHNTLPCDDGNVCTSPDVCSASECHGTVLDCSWLSDQCNTGICDPTSGQCRPQPSADGTPCDDGDSCTADETCSGGVCIQGSYSCDNGSACACATGYTKRSSLLYLLAILAMLAMRKNHTRG